MNAPRIFTPDYYERMRALEDDGWWNAAMRDVAGMLLRRVALPSTGLLLDVGCGSGQTIGWFKSIWPGWRTAGLDVAPEGLEAARAAGRGALIRGSALTLPVDTSSTDLVITLDVVQHLPLNGGDRAAFGEIRRVLKPGGLLLLRTNAQATPSTSDDPGSNFHKYEVRELRQRLGGAGFEVLRISRLNAVLGLAEIPRELAARRQQDDVYHGILAAPGTRTLGWRFKRRWLRLEGLAVASGIPLPFGRTIVALARAPGNRPIS